MNKISLVGYFDDLSTKTGEGARIIDAHLNILFGTEVIESNYEMGLDLLSNIKMIKEQALKHAAIFDKSLFNKKFGIRIQFNTEEKIQKLEDISYGLPLYALIFCELLNLPVNNSIVGSGAINESGVLLPVEKLEFKENAVRKADFAHFLYPGSVVNVNLSGIKVYNKEQASYIWSGPAVILQYINNLDDPDQIFSILRDFISIHINELFPANFGENLYRLGKSNSLIIRAIKKYKSEWILTCLKNISTLEIQNYNSLIQLLEPENDIKKFIGDPVKSDNFIHEVFENLIDLATKIPDIAVFSTASFIRLLNSEISISNLISSSISFRKQMILIMDNAVNSCSNDEQLNGVTRGNQIISSFLNDLSIIDLDFSNPDDIRKDQIYLQLSINYENNLLKGISYSFPDYPNIAASQLQNPIALIDSSSSLPPKLRRLNWTYEMSAMEALPNSSHIFNRLGTNNLFIFPPMMKNGLETRIKWGDGTGTWPPSIDTLHLISILAKNSFYGRQMYYKKVCDLGCGTGIHGLMFALNSKVNYIDFIDIEPSAGLTLRNNVFENLSKVKGIEYSSKDFLDGKQQPFEEAVVRFLKEKIQNLTINDPYDLLICTPPYVPFIDILNNPLMWRAVAGTELLNFVLKNAKSIAKKTIIQFSDIALPEVKSLKNCKIIGKNIVGFRIPPLTEYFTDDERASIIGEKWMNKVKKYIIDVDKEKNEYNDHGFRYLHEVKTYLIE